MAAVFKARSLMALMLHRCRYGIPDPDAPKPPPSSLRRASAESSGDEDDDARSTASGSRKHIAFGAGAGEEFLFFNACCVVSPLSTDMIMLI